MTKLKVEADGAWVDAEDLYVEEGGQWNLLGPAAQAPTPSFVQLATITPAVVSGNLIFWHPTSSQFPFAYALTNGNNRVDNDGMAPARIHNRSFTPRIDRFVNDETVPSNMVFTGWVGIIRRLFWDVTQEGASGSTGGAAGSEDQPGASGQQTAIPRITGEIRFDNDRNVWIAEFTAAAALQPNDIVEVEFKQFTGPTPTAITPGRSWIRWSLGLRRVGSIETVTSWSVDLPNPSQFAAGVIARTRVTRPPAQVSIDSITVDPPRWNVLTPGRANRQATVNAATTGATQARLRLSQGLATPSWGEGQLVALDDRIRRNGVLAGYSPVLCQHSTLYAHCPGPQPGLEQP